MQYSQNFYTNVALFVLALIVLGLSIWAFVTPCKKDGFGDNRRGCCPNDAPIGYCEKCSTNPCPSGKTCKYHSTDPFDCPYTCK